MKHCETLGDFATEVSVKLLRNSKSAKLRFPADHRHRKVAYVDTGFSREDELSISRGGSDWFNASDSTPEKWAC